jgi:hypothetical protein
MYDGKRYLEPDRSLHPHSKPKKRKLATPFARSTRNTHGYRLKKESSEG